jgi:DNA-binding transcriptional MerR regulator
MSDGTDGQHDDEGGKPRTRKAPDAFRTISEVADDLQVPQHVLRFWETRFPQIRPLKRGGGRRYYRPEDVGLLRRIADLLYTQGYTIKGVQRLLREGGGLLQDNIPPASIEERMEAEAERGGSGAAEPAPRRPAADVGIPELPIPGLAPETPAESVRVSLRPPKARPATQSDPERELARLRGVLAETLHALEALRRLIG